MPITRRHAMILLSSAIAAPAIAAPRVARGGVAGEAAPKAISVIGTAFRVDGNQNGNQSNPTLTPIGTGATGGFMAGWYRRSSNLAVDEMYVRYFRATGLPVAAPLRLESDFGDPVPIGSTNGSAVVLYEFDPGTGTSSDIFAQRMTPAGAKLGSRIPVNTGDFLDNQTRLVAARLSTDNIAVAWIDENGSPGGTPPVPTFDVRGRIIRQTATGVVGVTDDAILTTSATGHEQPHAIAPLAAGGFVLAYTARTGPDTRPTGTLLLQRFDATAARVGAPIVLKRSRPVFDAKDPDVCALPNGGFAAVFTDRAANGSGLVRGRFFSPNGALGAAFSAAAGLDGDFDLHPQILALPNGNVAVVSGALEQISGNIKPTVLAYVFNKANGQLLSGPTRIFTSPTGFSAPQPRSLIRLSGGKYVVSWTLSPSSGVKRAMAMMLTIT